jgi:hypothetical protein
MLKDRKVLLEHELKKAHNEAANMYLNIVISNGDKSNSEYESIKSRIMDLQFDLGVVNDLINKGHE